MPAISDPRIAGKPAPTPRTEIAYETRITEPRPRWRADRRFPRSHPRRARAADRFHPAGCAGRLGRGPAQARSGLSASQRRLGRGRLRLRSGRLPQPAAARLPLGRRQRLRQSRRAGAQGPWRRDAGVVLARPADVPGRRRCLYPAAQPDPPGRRSLGHRPGGRAGSDHRRRADGRHAGRSGRPYPPADAGQRRLPAQSDPRRTSQGLWLLPEQAVIELLAGGHHPGRAGRELEGRQGTSAAGVAYQRRAVRPAERRRRHDLQLPNPGSACRQDPAAGRGHHHRLGHGVELRPQRRLELPGGKAHAGDRRAGRGEDAVPQVRRPGTYRDVRRCRAEHLRRHRSGGGKVRRPLLRRSRFERNLQC